MIKLLSMNLETDTNQRIFSGKINEATHNDIGFLPLYTSQYLRIRGVNIALHKVMNTYISMIAKGVNIDGSDTISYGLDIKDSCESEGHTDSERYSTMSLRM